MSNQNAAFKLRKGQKLANSLIWMWGISHHQIGDSSQCGDFRRNLHLRIYEGIKSIYDLTIFYTDRTDLGDLRVGSKPGGFKVNHHVIATPNGAYEVVCVASTIGE